MSTMATRLKELLRERQMSESELARRSGVPQSTINRIVLGTSQSPRLSSLEKVAKALDISVSELIHDNTMGAARLRQANALGKASPLAWISPALSTGAMLVHTTLGSMSSLTTYPLIPWQAVMSEMPEPASPGKLGYPLLSSDHRNVGVAFWLSLQESSIALPLEGMAQLMQEAVVLFDTGIAPEPGQLVLACLKGDASPVCRRLVDRAGTWTLNALHDDEVPIEADKVEAILAVAVEAKVRLLP